MRFLRQSLVGVFLASLTVALLIYAGQMVMSAVQDSMADDRSPAKPRERIFAVNVKTADFQTVTPILEAFGQVQSRRTLELRAATGGRVIWLADNFEEGGAVEQGEVLLKIDPADAQSAFDRIESDQLDSQAEIRDAERAVMLAGDELAATQDQADLRDRAFRRQQDLLARGVGTAAAVEAAELVASSARQAVLTRRIALAGAEARVDQASTRLARAGIALAEAQRDLEETTLTAEFKGTLGSVTLVQGRLVSANEKLAELIDPNALEVAFRVSTAQYARLLDETGQLIKAPVVAMLDVTGVELKATGRVSRDSVAAGDGQSGRMIYARLDKAPGFKPGDFVTVAVEEPALDNVARLPASSLDAAQTVLVLDPKDRLESLPVVLIRRQGDDVLLRGAGLAGREVVIGRTPLLGAGIRVRPLRDGPAAVATEPETTELSKERRARLIAFVEANKKMPDSLKTSILTTLGNDQVPTRLIDRLESRMGG